MGNDGGSIPKRRELVKEAALKPNTTQIKETQQEQQEYHWTTCPLSHQPLKPPIVSDSSGKLYNKDAILEFLLPPGDGTPGMSKSDNEEVLEGRVRSLRDVVEVRLQTEEESEANPSGKASPRGLKWVCPITNKALGPGVKAVYLVPCGHAFSESAIKEMAGENCLQCNESYDLDNMITILPVTSSDKERLIARAQRLRSLGLTHSLKKISGSGKKRKKNIETNAMEVTEEGALMEKEVASKIKVPHESKGIAKISGGIKNAATATLTAKVLAEEEERVKRRKREPNENLKTLFSSGTGKHKDGDFMTRGFSIPAGARH